VCVQVKNKSDDSAVENSYSVTASEQLLLSESQYSARKEVRTMFGQRHKKMTTLFGGEVTQLCTVKPVCLSPPVTCTTPAAHWLNRSLPAQSRSRVYCDDGTLAGATCLQRGRPNSLTLGLPSPLQRSLLVSTGMSAPAACAKDVAVIDTSPILSAHSVTSTVCKSGEHFAAAADNDKDGSTLVHSESKVSLGTHVDDSTHNQAFTESMLADPDCVDSSAVDGADASYTDSVECDDDVSCHDTSQLSLPLLSQSSMVRLLSPAVSSYSDLAVQSSTTSLDSAVEAENVNESHLDGELYIPRSFSKQSVVSHDSGVGMADPHPTDISSKLRPTVDCTSFSHEGSHCIGLRNSVCRQSARISPNLLVSTDVRNLLCKAGLPLDTVSDREKENAEKPAPHVKLPCFNSGKAVTSECRRIAENHAPPPCCMNLPSSATVSRRQSKLLPVLPISTNLLRVSCEQYSSSVKRCITNSSAAAAVASPAMSAGPPRIKSALLTPSFNQCLSAVDATSQLRSRFRGKPVKRLQSSPYPSHSPVNPLSPRHVTTSGQTTVAVPFDLDV